MQCVDQIYLLIVVNNSSHFFIFAQALEYAKTIAKPKAPPKSNDRSREKNLNMQASYLQEMDPTQLATLEMLRRHEEEKRAVARFKTIHAI